MFDLLDRSHGRRVAGRTQEEGGVVQVRGDGAWAPEDTSPRAGALSATWHIVGLQQIAELPKNLEACSLLCRPALAVSFPVCRWPAASFCLVRGAPRALWAFHSPPPPARLSFKGVTAVSLRISARGIRSVHTSLYPSPVFCLQPSCSNHCSVCLKGQT